MFYTCHVLTKADATQCHIYYPIFTSSVFYISLFKFKLLSEIHFVNLVSGVHILLLSVVSVWSQHASEQTIVSPLVYSVHTVTY